MKISRGKRDAYSTEYTVACNEQFQEKCDTFHRSCIEFTVHTNNGLRAVHGVVDLRVGVVQQRFNFLKKMSVISETGYAWWE